MYISLGEKAAILSDDVIGIFDMEKTTTCLITKQFLINSEQQGTITVDTGGIPRSFILSRHGKEKSQVRLSICTSTTLGERHVDSN